MKTGHFHQAVFQEVKGKVKVIKTASDSINVKLKNEDHSQGCYSGCSDTEKNLGLWSPCSQCCDERAMVTLDV